MTTGQVPVALLAGMVADLVRTVEVLLSALDGGEAWEIDNARNLAHQTLAALATQAPPASRPTRIHIPLTRKVSP